jgi:Ni2+-binding GTPase involved in maturation of urease and hydrogenase
MSKLTVTVSGHPGAGKTTLIHLLVRTLKRCGFKNVTVVDCLGEQEDPAKSEDAVKATSRSEIVIRSHYPGQPQPPKTKRKV